MPTCSAPAFVPAGPGDGGDRRAGTAIEYPHYLFAAASTCVAVAVTLLVTRWLEDVPLLVLLTAVMASALRGGMGPGLVATALSGVAVFGATHVLASDFHIPAVNLGSEILRVVIFVVVAIGICLLGDARRRAERERDDLLLREQAAREQAEGANLAKDRLLATVSHELRNPLAAILSWSSLLRDGEVGTDRARRGLDAIERNARSQARLVDDLLDVSCIVTGKLRLEVRPTDLAPVIEAALETVRPAAQAKHIALQVSLDRRTGLVRGDPDRLLQIVWNLLSNAIKFTPEGGRVWIRLERFNTRAELCVSDTGEGIDPGFLPHIFEPFSQAGTGRNRRTSGLGLGLAIVRHLVELHGGTVLAHSCGAGKGTLFRVAIPLMEAGHEVRPEAEGAPPGLSLPLLRGVGVLVVQDQADMREALRTALAAYGAEVRVAGSTREALDVLDRWRPVVVVSDLGMPGEEGYALIRRLRERQRGRTLAAVALTGTVTENDRERVLAAGYQAHVSRDGDLAELASIVASLADGPREKPTLH